MRSIVRFVQSLPFNLSQFGNALCIVKLRQLLTKEKRGLKVQIRKQLRVLANTFALDPPLTPEPNGYSGIHRKMRWKSSKNHPGRGSKVGQSKKAKK